MEDALMAGTARKATVRTTATKRVATKPPARGARKTAVTKAKSTTKSGVRVAKASSKAAATRTSPVRKTAKKPTKKTTNPTATSRARARARTLRVAVELGSKGKKVAVVARDWPGLERGERTEDAAIELLQSYLPRYAAVAKLAGLDAEFTSITSVDVVERYRGPGSTDFWGISFGFSSFDLEKMSSEQLERELALMQACWTFFDSVRARVSSEMQKGPRGGGRDRDRIAQHTLGVEQDWATKLGVRTPTGAVVTDARGLKAYRRDYCAAIREFHAEGKMARTWPLRYLIRHTAYHTMDHAWEMEDKDMTVRRRKPR
jgi:hypothetical protein